MARSPKNLAPPSAATVAGRSPIIAVVSPETSLPTQMSINTAIEEYLGFQYSILNDEPRFLRLEKIRWLYYVMLPAMLLVALWIHINYWVWFKTKGQKLKDRFQREVGPEQMSFWFDRVHPQAMRVRNGVTTSDALDVVYSMPRYLPFYKIRGLGDVLVWFWLNQPDAQGPRNRLRLTYQALVDEFTRLKNAGRGRGEDAIECLSLACGSAQATIEAVARFRRENPEINIRLLLVDQIQRSLELANELAIRRGVGDIVTIHRSDLVRFLHVNQKQWDIIEMVGYLDYKSESSLVKFCKRVRSALRPNGLFLTAHIAPSLWAYVVRWVTNWPGLIRRTEQEFVDLLIQSDFSRDKIQSVLEPTGTHIVASCRK